MNILLVDDDLVDRTAIKRALASPFANHKVTDVDSAEHALGMLDELRFDIVLLDYQMPKMNGMEFVVKVKNMPASKHLAIVMISNSSSEDIILECINAGAQDFLLKDEVNSSRLSRAMLQAKKRFELEHKLYESYRQVKELAEHDALTGLSNRYHFEEALHLAIASSARMKTYVAVLLFDLDHFKKINDSFGHEVGDQLLKQVSVRIKTKLRSGETFARLGGDEFALVIEGAGFIHQVKLVANRILSVFNHPFEVNGHEVHCSGSMGIAICPVNGSRAEELVKYADIAMYRAKSAGRNQACIFEDNMQREFYRKYMIEQDLRRAVREKGFTLHYQPLVSLKDESVVGLEALIRWPHAQITTYPDEFIPIAEESHIIEELGKWIVSYAIERLAVLRKELKYDMYMSINLSSLQLQNEKICEHIQYSLKKHDLKPENLMLEITETALLDEDIMTYQVIEKLHNLGCKIALDDFGTGYSSISHLLNYPIDVVKLHKSLIDGSTRNQRHSTIMTGLCSMLNQLGISVVAEGIEEQDQLGICKQCNVKLLQGYLFSKPLPENDLRLYLVRH